MTREEYAKRMKKHPDWAPGWDAIDAAFAKLYPEAEPVRFESELHDRAALGGEEYLDGFAVYDTGKGYQHVVTYGLSELYPSMAAFGSEYSKWGYELTLKVRESYAETGTWALDLLAQLARYTFQTGNYFEPGAYRRRRLPASGAKLGHHGAGHRQRHDRRTDRDCARQGRVFAAGRSHAAGAGRGHARPGRTHGHSGADARRGSGAGARYAQNKVLHINCCHMQTAAP